MPNNSPQMLLKKLKYAEYSVKIGVSIFLLFAAAGFFVPSDYIFTLSTIALLPAIYGVNGLFMYDKIDLQIKEAIKQDLKQKNSLAPLNQSTVHLVEPPQKKYLYQK